MLIVIGVLVVLAGAGLYWGSLHVAPYAIIRPSRVGAEDRQRLREQFYPLEAEVQLDTVSVRSKDGLLLRALLLQPRDSSQVKGALICLHGIANCKESYLPFAWECTRLGYACLLPDLRAHGESEGMNCTFGWNEKEDISLFIIALQARISSNAPIGIYGYSLGGAVALQTAAVDKRLKFAIIESTFSSLPAIIPEYQARLMHFRWPWLAAVALKRAGEIAGFVPEAISPVHSAAQLTIPVLMAHGTADASIPIVHGETNYAALTCPRRWYPIPGGTHPNLDAGGGLAPYRVVRTAFLREQLR